ncbi:MAG: hypothetical protein FWE44_01300, partial [Defluviitaleaceae bacterium]|nr:hypothetical protein [Defluviitaleaceae bacterium]
FIKTNLFNGLMQKTGEKYTQYKCKRSQIRPIEGNGPMHNIKSFSSGTLSKKQLRCFFDAQKYETK